MKRIVNDLVDRLRREISTDLLLNSEDIRISVAELENGDWTIRFFSTAVLKLRSHKAGPRLEVKTLYATTFGLLGSVVPTGNRLWSVTECSSPILDRVITTAHEVYDKCGPRERIACCSQYVECSDARRCLIPNEPWARGCLYGENLKQGRIFYGKNRNVG